MPLGQRVPHMPPKRRQRIRDLLCELFVGAIDGLTEMKAGKVVVPATFACLGDPTEDAGELVQPSFRRSSASDVAISSRRGTSSKEAPTPGFLSDGLPHEAVRQKASARHNGQNSFARKTKALLRVLEDEGREPCFRSLICGITTSVMRIFFARLVNRNSLRSS
jgi:hypothetical protein